MRIGTTVMLIVATTLGIASAETTQPRVDNPVKFQRIRSAGSNTVSFLQLDSRPFQPKSLFPISDEARRTLYEGRFFVNGKPVFVFKFATQRKPDVEFQRAYADFGGFHARVEGTNNVITVPYEDSSVMNHLKRIEQTSWAFGNNAALLSHGYRASPPAGPGKNGHEPLSPPDWDIIHESDKVSRDLPYEEMKRTLNEKRYLVFKDPQHSLSLAVRALPDGRIQRQLIDSLGHVRIPI